MYKNIYQELLAWRENAAIRAGCCYGERPGVDRAYVEVDGTGVPMRRSETEGVKGNQKVGSAQTREAKVIVTSTTDGRHPKTGAPMKDKNSDAVSAWIDSAATVGRVSGMSEFVKRLIAAPPLPNRRLQVGGSCSHL